MAEFDLNLLRPLDALLRERSVTRAARFLGVSQPTMSGMLARLREQLRDPLLVRVGRSLELTARASTLVPEVRQTLLRADRIGTPLGPADPSAIRRHFRIMASEFGLYLILPKLFARAATEAPLATFEAVPIDRPEDSVFAGNVDLCLTGDMLTAVDGSVADAVRTQTIGNDRFVGIVATDHPLDGAVTIDQLLCHPHVATHFPGSSWMAEDIGLAGLSDRHPPRVRIASFLAMGRMVAGTDAIGIIPGRLAKIAAAGLKVRLITLPDEFRTIALKLLWHDRYADDPPHRWLREAIIGATQSLNEAE